ncbi:MAG: CHAP domain-containing protein [Lachnospiraceae bacterium]|nr:CHAP domain-containing protein [Lachnospiraceae bacterium]
MDKLSNSNVNAHETLRQSDKADKLSASRSDSHDMLKSSVQAAGNIAEKTVTNRIQRGNQSEMLTNKETASEYLLGSNKELELGDRERTFNRSDKLYTASRRRTKSEMLRTDRESSVLSGMDDSNSKKLHDTKKKLSRKLQDEYNVKTEIKGGLKTDLRVEKSVKSKLYDAPNHKPTDVAGSIGQRALHFMDDMADNEENSTQNAWIDTAGKGADGVSKVFSLSQTAKYWRMSKNEAEIAKLARQEEKIVRNSFRMEYKSALKTTKEGVLWKESNLYDRHLQKKAIKKKYMKNAIAEYQKAKKAGSAGKVTYSTGFSLADKVKAGASSVGQTLLKVIRSPAGKIAIVCMIVLIIITTLIGASGSLFMMMLGGSSSSVPMGAGFPPEVEQWRTFVVDRCNYYKEDGDCDLTQFVNAILATIQQESGGNSASCGGDIMQDKASGNWESGTPPDWNSFTTEQKSIDAGVRYFYSGLKGWGVTKPDDYDGLQMVAQGYNYGYGFFDYAKGQNATKWSLSLSQAFADSKGGNYGHPPYGEEWLAKYMAGGALGSGEIVVEKGSGGVVKTAQGQLNITEDPPGTNNVIFNTEYYGGAVSGDAYPWCCVFVWWCFDKSGNGDAFYYGDKTAACSEVRRWATEKHLAVSGNKAQYGDLVIFGNDEHIGIVIANNGDGSYTTIEGNTSSDDAGSQSNGGGVFIKKRYENGSFPITMFIRPQYDKVK